MRILNRKFGREYEELEQFEVGIMLTGPEVKSIRAEKIKLDDSFVKVIGGELFLVNAEIYPYQYARPDKQESKRSRK
ncbi:SsrA-binding protein, partial [Candidatus Microgenomates bacterium]|nr:SsrA-binding protein [Candidatus Microgenomates bacterium]